MTYLLDKKTKRNRTLKIVIIVFIFIILFFVKSYIFNAFSYLGQGVFNPVVSVGNNLSNRMKSLKTYFISKNSLYQENLDLKSQLESSAADRANYYSIVQENADLKDVLGRKKEDMKVVLASILIKPNQSLYDTLVLDVGENMGIKVGATVFALGDIPIGKVAEVYSSSSRVVLFSTNGEKTQVVLSAQNTFLELVGRGGGNFEMIIPRDFKLLKGEQVVLPGISPKVVAVVETIISDPRDAFQKALLVAPVNIQELKFVEVQI